MSTTDLDRPCMSWSECTDWDNTSCVIARPHDADPFLVALDVRHTEAGGESDPSGDDIKSITKSWARIFSLREQWETYCANRGEEPGTDGPPKGWYPDEDTAGWSLSETPIEGYTEVWVISWA